MFHSNSSPFNQRQPKAGPSVVSPRYHQDASPKSPMELPKRSAPFKESMPLARPIITNSRVKQDEKYKKDMYLAFVNNALLQKSKGNVEPFDELVSQFNANKCRDAGQAGSATPVSQLRLWISALSHVVSQLERTHSALVDAVISMPWTTMDANFVKAYMSFIGMLVSARPEYLSMVLEKAARGFTFRSGLHALASSTPEGSSSPLTHRIVYERLHNLLQHLLSLIPTLPSTLQPLLVRNFPHKRQDKADQVTYIRNLLRITEYCPELADQILATIIDRAIQIDVEIQVEMEELEGDDSTRENAEVFMLDPFDIVVGQEGNGSEDEDDGDADDISDISSGAEGDPDDDDAPPKTQTDVSHVRDMIEKLDSMLKLVFDHFHRSHSSLTTTLRSATNAHDPPPDVAFTSSPTRPPSPLHVSPEQGRDLRRVQFITLLSIFDRTIIRTFKSRYTQFLVFWYSSLDPEFTDMFQGLLVSKALFEETQPVVTRAAAASYIASFVSRAQFVDGDSAKRVVTLLCDFLATHLDMCATMGDAFDPCAAHHTLFYAVAQAVFLIFCFRWRDLQLVDEVDLDDLANDNVPRKKWIPKLDVMQRVVTSSLNPLKICSPNVVQQFARVAQSTGFIYCYTILEANRRSDQYGSHSSTPQKSTTPSGATTPSHRTVLLRDAADADLSTFFPFDPYKLPLSYSYIQGVYREWASVALDDEEEEEEESDEEADEHGASRQPWGIELGQDDEDTGALGTSFGGMSISPVQPAIFGSMA